MTKASREEHNIDRRREPAILFAVDPYVFAIAAGEVQEICSTDNLAGSVATVSLPELTKVRHTLQRRKRIYYVVNASAHFRMKSARASLVLILRNSRAAVLVDRIERIAEIAAIRALPRAFYGEERFWYRGLVILDDQVVPVVNPSAFLTDEELRMLEGMQTAASQGKPSEDTA